MGSEIADESGFGVSALQTSRYRNLIFSILIELFLFLSAVLVVVLSRRLDSAARQRMQFAEGSPRAADSSFGNRHAVPQPSGSIAIRPGASTALRHAHQRTGGPPYHDG